MHVLLPFPHTLPACLAALKLNGRKVAVFGCGDMHGYGE